MSTAAKLEIYTWKPKTLVGLRNFYLSKKKFLGPALFQQQLPKLIAL
jgi:hypothetical protein